MLTGDSRVDIDTSKPHPARVYDWLLGGSTNYPVDEKVGAALPEETRGNAARNRAFIHRATGWLAKNGIAQYLDIGTGIPTEPNIHQVVQAIAPDARIVYADNDPIVLQHSEALLTSTREGVTRFLHADVRQPASILEHAGEVLDFDRPVALSLFALLHFLPDDEAYGIVRALVEALPSGSFLLLSHGTVDEHPEWEGKVEAAYEQAAIPLRLRTRSEVVPFFKGLELVAPGLVSATEWYQEDPAPALERSGFHVGVAQVP
ncbi:SAM-dependent methyltransferase [Nocardia sp. NPDC050799]|uniref:SAM-dependent methyltransferase n=1 Tax=Nocardia sp. NPDC050799 TaxID=3154842 RepID=UPI0033C24D2B